MNDTLSAYEVLLVKKRHTSGMYGIDPVFMPKGLFDYQEHICNYGIKKGRCANFLDTGTGKTIIELVTASNFVKATNKRALIITPLAVAFQFVKEAEKFGIDDVSYSKKGELNSKIIICNYERIHLFDPSDFDCVILDESSILKNVDGAIKHNVTVFLKKVKYRYLFTATPSPNDFIELGTSSEALGYMGYTDMLTKFFSNNENTIKAQSIHNKFYLKAHAQDSFFRWVGSWSVSMRHPSDLGFDDSKLVLPDLKMQTHSVKNPINMLEGNQIMLFNKDAKTQSEVRKEQRDTVESRCELAAELASHHDTSVYWVNYNTEGDLLAKLDKDSKQLSGSMSLEAKEELLIAFAKGEVKKLITKAKMTAFGLNWQHCGHTIFFPTFSFEQFYQSLRRFWRFGRVDDVIADLIISDGQKRVIDAIHAKIAKHDALFDKLNKHINTSFDAHMSEFDKEIIMPSFLK